MAVFDLNVCRAAYCALSDCLKELLPLAQNGEWDALEERIPRYLLLINNLPAIDWQAMPRDEQLALAALLSEIKVMQDTLMAYSQAWRDELGGILQGIHNTGRLDKAYRL